MTDTKVAPEDDASFTARVSVEGAPPDGDGDIIAPGATTAGQVIAISLSNHDSLLNPQLAPAGEGVVAVAGRSVLVHGQPLGTARGKALRSFLRAGGPSVEWSVGFRSLEARDPTRAEIAQFPDARRVILSWQLIEASPVERGSCGPSCRTISAKGARPSVKCFCGDRSVDAKLGAEFRRFRQISARCDKLLGQPASAPVTDAELARLRRQNAQEYARFLAATTPVSREKHLLALEWTAAAAAAWGIRTPAVKWGVNDPRHGGQFQFSDPFAIHLNASTPTRLVPRLCAHEVSHLARFHGGLPNGEAEVNTDAAAIVAAYS